MKPKKTKSKIRKTAKSSRGKKALTMYAASALRATQMDLVFWSGARKSKVLLRVDLMLIDSGSGLMPTTLVQVRESTVKNVSAMVTNVRQGPIAAGDGEL